MTKNELRKMYLQKRQGLSEEEWTSRCKQICNIFFREIELKAVRNLHTFLPIRKNKEPDTWLIIDRLKAAFTDIRLVVPKVNLQTGILDNYFFEGPGQLVENSWGIPEPRSGTLVPVTDLDMILIPLLAFDRSGSRIGYGKGFYDQLLSSCRHNCQKVGLSFFPPVEQPLPSEAHDQRLDCVVTPGTVFRFSDC